MSNALLGPAKLLIALVAFLAICIPPALSSGEPPGAEQRRYIVLLEDSVDHPGAVARAQTEQHGGRAGFIYRHALTGYSAFLQPAAAEALRRDPRVSAVHRDHRRVLAAQPNPTGITRVFAASNKALQIDEKDNVVVNADVAVLDSGIELHPDLKVVDWTYCNGNEEGATCSKEGTSTDEIGHGTHVAGIVGAVDNGIGVVGVAPSARLWNVKVRDAESWESEEIAGIDWVTKRADQIEVVNMSLGCGGLPCEAGKAWQQGIAKSVDAGIVYVVAAGNDKGDAKSTVYGTHPDVITVSALADYDGEPEAEAEALWLPSCKAQKQEKDLGKFGADDTWATFSNYGKDIEITAPGVCIYSTLPKAQGEYGYESGTSMAAPHVAGAAAILADMSNPKGRKDVERIRKVILDAGSYEWTDTSPEEPTVQEPLLDMHDEELFDPELEWTIEGKSLQELELEEEQVEGTGGPFTYEVPPLGIAIGCKAHSTAATISQGGASTSTVNFTECRVVDWEGNELACEVVEPIVSSAKGDLIGIGKTLYPRFVPAVGEAFTTIVFEGELCPLPEKVPVTGKVAGEIKLEEQVKQGLIFSKAIAETATTEMFFGGQAAFLVGNASVELGGANTGDKWGA